MFEEVDHGSDSKNRDSVSSISCGPAKPSGIDLPEV